MPNSKNPKPTMMFCTHPKHKKDSSLFNVGSKHKTLQHGNKKKEIIY